MNGGSIKRRGSRGFGTTGHTPQTFQRPCATRAHRSEQMVGQRPTSGGQIEGRLDMSRAAHHTQCSFQALVNEALAHENPL